MGMCSVWWGRDNINYWPSLPSRDMVRGQGRGVFRAEFRGQKGFSAALWNRYLLVQGNIMGRSG